MGGEKRKQGAGDTWPEDGKWEPGEAVQGRIKRQDEGEEEAPTEEEFKKILRESSGG